MGNSKKSKGDGSHFPRAGQGVNLSPTSRQKARLRGGAGYTREAQGKCDLEAYYDPFDPAIPSRRVKYNLPITPGVQAQKHSDTGINRKPFAIPEIVPEINIDISEEPDDAMIERLFGSAAIRYDKPIPHALHMPGRPVEPEHPFSIREPPKQRPFFEEFPSIPKISSELMRPPKKAASTKSPSKAKRSSVKDTKKSSEAELPVSFGDMDFSPNWERIDPKWKKDWIPNEEKFEGTKSGAARFVGLILVPDWENIVPEWESDWIPNTSDAVGKSKSGKKGSCPER